MALKKSQIYSSLWASCDELRGGMDASQYKDYVLTLLFMKYVSDKYAGKAGGVIEVPTGGSFADMVALKGKKDIGEGIDKIISKLAEANGLKGVIDVASFNDDDKLGKGQEMVDRLSKLVGIFETLDFGTNRAEGDDLLGDAYEYLMRHFATESGKSKGQFYTPAEVSRIMAKVVGIGTQTKPDDTIYDPTCGSGSLLLKAADEAPHGMSIYGQENDLATWALARMNMFLHGHATAELWKGNTLSAPYFKKKDGSLETFDFAVANPPFSAKSWSNGVKVARDEFKRFEYGIPPAKNGDYAFLLHLIKSLKGDGKGAIILPLGVLSRGNKEADIRRNLIKQGLIKGLIGLPQNLFYGTGVPACIVVIDKENAHVRTGIFMIDASKGFVKDGNKNRLREQDIHKIVDVFNRQLDLPRYSRMVPVSEIGSQANEYNLNIPRYIDSSESEDLHDLDAHLRGGIPNRDVDALEAYWKVFPSLRKQLFEPGDRAGYGRAKVEAQFVKSTLLDHPEFTNYSRDVEGLYAEWRVANEPMLKELKKGSKPKAIINAISEDLLERFTSLPLLSSYDAYQRLTDYWADVMQDDLYLISAEGWADSAKPRAAINNKEKKISETPDLTVNRKKYKMDLIPPNLIMARYCVQEQAELEQLEATSAETTRILTEFVDENGGDDGFFEDPRNEKGRITKAAIRDLQDLLLIEDSDPESPDIRVAVNRCLELIAIDSAAANAVKTAKASLDAEVLKTYATLSEAEIKILVVEDKWFATIWKAIQGEIMNLAQSLANRLSELEARYALTMQELESDADLLNVKVRAHIKRIMEHLLTKKDDAPASGAGWRETTLEEVIVDCSSGSTPSRNHPEYYRGDIRWITSGELRYGVIMDTREKITPEAVKKTNLKIIPAGTFLMAITGLEAEGTRGSCGIVGAESTTNQSCMAIFPSEELLSEYLFYYYVYRGKTLALQYCQGTKQQSYTAKTVRKLPICFPSEIDEQRTIVDVLADLDAFVAATERRREKVKAIRLGMMQALLNGRVRLK